jgi:lipopolysaccharide biosynthesis glycosyltransferase
MILPKISGQTNITQDSFYFAADTTYLNLYGKALALSLKEHAPWSNIHIHIFNPTPEQLIWCTGNNITFSYEGVDTAINELRTYYACVRFIRIPEIFNSACRIISLDCDGIVVKPITKDKFITDTNTSKVLWREKQQMSLASSVFYGLDNFRVVYADKLKPYFENDTFKWFLDQNIMDEMIRNNEIDITVNTDWGNGKVGKNTLIWTGKGDKKFNPEFQQLLQKYNK